MRPVQIGSGCLWGRWVFKQRLETPVRAAVVEIPVLVGKYLATSAFLSLMCFYRSERDLKAKPNLIWTDLKDREMQWVILMTDYYWARKYTSAPVGGTWVPLRRSLRACIPTAVRALQLPLWLTAGNTPAPAYKGLIPGSPLLLQVEYVPISPHPPHTQSTYTQPASTVEVVMVCWPISFQTTSGRCSFPQLLKATCSAEGSLTAMFLSPHANVPRMKGALREKKL